MRRRHPIRRSSWAIFWLITWAIFLSFTMAGVTFIATVLAFQWIMTPSFHR